MKRISLLTVLACAVVVTPAAAFQEDHGPGGLPDYDSRSGDRAAIPARTEAGRDALEDHLGEEALVESDAELGGVRSIARTDGFLSPRSSGDPAGIALRYVREHPLTFGLDEEDLAGLRLAARYRSGDGVTHLTWRQTSRGIPSYDSVLSANVASAGQIVSINGSPVHDLSIPSATPGITAASALAAAKEDVGAPMTPPAVRDVSGAQRVTHFANGDHARLVVFADAGGDRLAWRLSVKGVGPYVYNEVIDAATGRLLARHSLTSFVSNASVFNYHPGNGPLAAVNVDLAADTTWLDRSTETTPESLRGRNAHAYADIGGGNGFSAGEDINPSAGTDWPSPSSRSPAARAARRPSSRALAPGLRRPGRPTSRSTARRRRPTSSTSSTSSTTGWPPRGSG